MTRRRKKFSYYNINIIYFLGNFFVYLLLFLLILRCHHPCFFFYNDSFQSAVDTASYLFLFAACLRVPLYPVLVLDSILYPYIIIFGKLLLGYRSSISSKPTDLADHFYDTQTILFFMIPIYYRKKKRRRRRSGVNRMFFV